MGRNKTDTKVKHVTHQNKTRKPTDHDRMAITHTANEFHLFTT